MTRGEMMYFFATVSCVLHMCYSFQLSPLHKLLKKASTPFENVLQSLDISPEDYKQSYLDEFSKFNETKFMEEFSLGSNNPDRLLDFKQLAEKYGHNVEVYTVQTEDGYIVTVYRLVGKGKPVLIVHGLLLSAVDWLTVGPESALPYLLADRGYDVWLLNVRGTIKESRGHVRYSAEENQSEYWNFSWEEIGLYDLPATIDFVLQKTGHENLTYVGHSQGNTAFYVMASERPEISPKVSLAINLSPVSFMSYTKSPIFKIPAAIWDPLTQVLRTDLGFNEFDAQHPLVRSVIDAICVNSPVSTIICDNVQFALTGFDVDQMNITNLPVIFSHMPSSVSMKQLTHYAQSLHNEGFRRYDHGHKKNMEIYGSEKPPNYPLEKIEIPLAIFYADDNDWLCAKKDVEVLLNKLPKDMVKTTYVVPHKSFCHNDFYYAKDVKSLVYDKVLELIDNNA